MREGVPFSLEGRGVGRPRMFVGMTLSWQPNHELHLGSAATGAVVACAGAAGAAGFAAASVGLAAAGALVGVTGA